MGTSSSGTGPSPSTPLLPNWIVADDGTGTEDNSDSGATIQTDAEAPTSAFNDSTNRYQAARTQFGKFSSNHKTNTTNLKKSLRSYVLTSGGGSSVLSKRMLPSISRVERFNTIINSFRENGAVESLTTFHLENYADKSLLDILSALTDIIFDDSNLYNNIQDDSITKLAYANTVNRISEVEGIDLDSLSNENVELMTAIFIEETIATRVICDIGVKLFEKVKDVSVIIDIEEVVYQIVAGLVRNDIMPEIIASQRGDVENLNEHIENIYRIAFDCIAATQ